MHWISTLVDQQYFPFYEFLWLCMLGLWWSVIARLKRIEKIQYEIISEIVDEGDK